MDLKALLCRFDGRSRLLLHSLHSGVSGAHSALRVFSRQRCSDPNFCLGTFLETLCQGEPCLDDDAHALTVKPLVCLFPVAFKWSLLFFLHLIHPMLPQTSLLRLLDCLSQEPNQKPWICALIGQLRRDLGDPVQPPPLSPQCRERMRGLCERLNRVRGKRSWASCLSGPGDPPPPQNETDQVRKKRKSKRLDPDSDAEEDAHQSKRMKMDLSAAKEDYGEEGLAMEADESKVGVSKNIYEVPTDDMLAPQQSATESPSCALPEHIKASIPLIKELLEIEMEWDQSSISVLNVLNECDPAQVELLCEILCLSEAPEQILPQFCSCLLALSPDLSHSTAAALIKSLLLGKVLSLTEPASRCLVTAATSLCSRYPRPICQALMEPVIEGRQTGSAQAELLCRLVEDFLEPHHRLLVFRMTLTGPWNEGILSVIHALLDSKLELSEELFSLFTDQLSSQSPNFTKSMKFAKMMLTVLTKYQSHVNAACQHTLSCCLPSNETFLKKSLQAALKRISNS